MPTASMPNRYQTGLREPSHSSMARNNKGVHVIAAKRVIWPPYTCRKCGAENISSAADTNAANGCSPRRRVQRYMNAPSSQTLSAMLQFAASGSGRARNNRLDG